LSYRLDVLQHMSLCRHYVRGLRRSVLLETPELEKTGSKHSSAILDQFGQLDDQGHNGNGDENKSRDQVLSAYLRQEAEQNGSPHAHGTNQSPHPSNGSPRRTSPNGRPSPAERLPRPSFMGSALHDTTDSDSPARTVGRADLRASAEKILYTYLLSGAEREIILPQGILNDIVTSIEDDHRDDPEVFDAAKDYTFQAMERDAFPGFLRSKALGNLVPASKYLRAIVGIAALFGGFWAAFACIFLDLSRQTRCWVSLLSIPYLMSSLLRLSDVRHVILLTACSSSSHSSSVSIASPAGTIGLIPSWRCLDSANIPS
jgi:hypothetical protein